MTNNELEGRKNYKEMSRKMKQNECIYLMFSGMKKKDIANLLGISEKTIYNWFHDPDFLLSLNCKVENLLGEVQTTLIKRINIGLETLTQLAENKDKTIKQEIQLDSAKTLVNVSFEIVEALRIIWNYRKVEEKKQLNNNIEDSKNMLNDLKILGENDII